jgi:hypothetical protein
VKANSHAVGIDKVILDELKDISNRRGRDPGPLNHLWEAECHAKKLFGICLSGGGIRSATFALGVLQGLTENELLPKADYLSTVSGGGYIGAWLQGVLHRDTAGYEKLKRVVPEYASKDPISFLRKYSNYLAPRVGLSLDAIVIPVIWLRNTMLNQTIIVAAFAALFLLLSSPGSAIHEIAGINSLCFSLIAMLIAGLLGAVAVSAIGYNLKKITKRQFARAQETAFQPGKGTERVGKLVVLPLVFGVMFLLFALISWPKPLQSLLAVLSERGQTSLLEQVTAILFPWVCLALLLWVLLTLLQWGGGFVECFVQRSRPKWLAWLHLIWMPLVSALFMWTLFVAVSKHLNSGLMSGQHAQYTIAVGPPLYLLVLHFGIALQIGLMGRDFPDSTREWLARAGALLLIVAAVWAGLFAIAVFAPFWVAKLWLISGKALFSAAGAWVISTLTSVLAGKSAKTRGEDEHGPSQSAVLEYVARYGPFVAIAGFMVLVAFGVQVLLRNSLLRTPGPFLGRFVDCYWDFFPDSYASWESLLTFLGIAVAVFALLSLRVDINEFSLHHFYKNRLVRCYMGASAGTDRKADPFTGFDPQDDIPLEKLQCNASPPLVRVPYPILNATLTVTEGSELATQERKAVPWIFTPRYSGFIPAPSDANKSARQLSEKGFVISSEILGGGVHVGTAMGISGAALSPNSGSHTAPQTAFLLTLFNVRLGWWVGNPRNLTTYRRPGPLFALWWLIRELFGFADERSAYLNLSDGGNFENLGLYELVRRRCHFVIAVDAEEDAGYKFGSLGGAVRKCRSDFGAEIDIDPRPIRPDNGHSHSHCVVGRIRYPEPDSSPGWLLYIKASLTGDEPADVQEYQRIASEFPQQSTLNQFFSESQFESYRRLGLHVSRTVIDRKEPEDLEELFSRLAVRWELAPPAPEGAFVHHAEAYSKLMHALMDSPDLENLDADVVEHLPETAHVDKAHRKAFFFYLDLLQFMENVFFDLNFTSAHAWNHPANAGWKTLFEYWAGKESLKAVWKAQKPNFSASFRNFFGDLGNADVAPPEGRRL